MLWTMSKTNTAVKGTKKITIPQKLWFDAYIFQGKNGTAETKYKENVQKTLNKYKNAWNIDTVEMEELTTEKCKDAISRIPIKGASTDLLNFHLDNDLQRHICRIAVLFLYGGYFLQEELEVIEPYIPSSDEITFVGVTTPGTGLFNGPFLASAPHHPLLYRALKKYILVAKGELKLETTSRFGEIMRSSFREVATINPDSKSDMVLFSEEQLDKLQLQHKEYEQVKKQDGEGPFCNYVIIDRATKKTYFYTRFPGAHEHQCDELVSTKPQVPKISQVQPKIPKVMPTNPQVVPKIAQLLPTIPHKLWFASKYEVSKLQKENRRHYENIVNTVRAYQKAWDIDPVEYKIFDIKACMNAIVKLPIGGASSTLFEYYMKEFKDHPNKGFDICRAAVLFLNGGYFFNEEVEVVEPYTAKNNNITFVGVKSQSGLFLPSFVASAAEHPVMREVITKYMMLAQGKIKTANAHPGGEIYRDSYNAKKKDIMSKSVLLLEKHLTLLSDEYKSKSKRVHKCSYVISDPDLKKINFFTRMYVDGEYCAGA